jgi:CBS domain-containing protein
MRACGVTLRETADIWEIARAFAARGVSGAPVVDEAGKLLGVVSQRDVIRYLDEAPRARPRTGGFYAEAEPDPEPRPARIPTARDLMSAPAISADEDTPVIRLCTMMLCRGIHRIIITRGSEVRGIVTTMDLLKVI